MLVACEILCETLIGQRVRLLIYKGHRHEWSTVLRYPKAELTIAGSTYDRLYHTYLHPMSTQWHDINTPFDAAIREALDEKLIHVTDWWITPLSP